MAENVPNNYIPKYAQQDEWEDKELQKFAIEFYRISDIAEENERWVQSFTEDAKIQIGADKARGTKEITDFRTRMWKHINNRKHTVLKVFPGRFPDSEDSEVMLLGEVSVTTNDGRLKEAAWSAHAVVKKVDGAWKFKEYRVWLQTDGHLL
ncbi:hypothetical protein NW768_000562 [Fusarium equiseti]|uniref:SnoaL-like domain-containing protein n=1 Tax=Fusarium equiseti TaxID=61235 RepID=A0ABQ8RT99_FUSEQ|nr:hypothetical protein NW768_000562 [Fusarium equiseti]